MTGSKSASNTIETYNDESIVMQASSDTPYLTILVDMDDVIENLCETWISYLNERYGTTVDPQQVREWDMKLSFPTLSEQEIYSPLLDTALWERVTPLPGAVETLQKLCEAGDKVLIVTASHPKTYALKYEYVLQKYFPFIPYKNMVDLHDKGLLKGDVIIDDNPNNIVKSLCRYQILFTRPHNQTYNCDETN